MRKWPEYFFCCNFKLKKQTNTTTKTECKLRDFGGFFWSGFLLSLRDKVQNRAKLKETQLARQICLLAELWTFKLPTWGTYLNLMSSARSLPSCGIDEKTTVAHSYVVSLTTCLG